MSGILTEIYAASAKNFAFRPYAILCFSLFV